MYDAGRQATMAEAQLQPSITKERNTLKLSLNSTAPIILAISVGAQQQTTILPRTLNSSKSTMEQKTAISTIQLAGGLNATTSNDNPRGNIQTE